MPTADELLIAAIRRAEPQAWAELIARFEGRLLAFADSRLRRRATSEDVVQETFIGFLTSLPNYDLSRPLESYLFSIAAHKLTDVLRREGRRPALSLTGGLSEHSSREPSARQRAVSSVARSGERRNLEEAALAAALRSEFARWSQRGEWQKVQCTELLFVRGWANKQTAEHLNISEQQVANQKFEFLARLRTALKKQELSADVFPELQP